MPALVTRDSDAAQAEAGSATQIEVVVLRVLKLPLFQPYRLSYRTFDEFEPIVAEVRLDDGRVGWGEGHISPGSSKETREGGWQFAQDLAGAIKGSPAADARQAILSASVRSPVAATALVTAIEMALGDPLLAPAAALSMPLLTPINRTNLDEIPAEIEELLAEGFRTFKVKVGKSVPDDLARVRAIQDAVAGRATLRLDANRAFDREQALAFVRGLDPATIELFEQPCATEAWDDNAAVAAASPVPLMLDEPICSIDDIERAGTIPNVGFCKIKLKRFSGLQRLRAALEAIRDRGMGPVLGDGLSSDICCWMEACVGAGIISGAGECNGFLKTRDRLLSPSLSFADGHVHVPAGYRPRIEWSEHAHLVTRELVIS
jgi:L-alanine-DL-glutamate epimerase-like enolase superfamily enzyme